MLDVIDVCLEGFEPVENLGGRRAVEELEGLGEVMTLETGVVFETGVGDAGVFEPTGNGLILVVYLNCFDLKHPQ